MAARQGQLSPRHVHNRLCRHHHNHINPGCHDSRIRRNYEPRRKRRGYPHDVPLPCFPGVRCNTCFQCHAGQKFPNPITAHVATQPCISMCLRSSQQRFVPLGWDSHCSASLPVSPLLVCYIARAMKLTILSHPDPPANCPNWLCKLRMEILPGYYLVVVLLHFR
jgi:hypothetical protein